MIGRLRGIIIEKTSSSLVLFEVGGIGYEVYMPITCLNKLPDIGKEAIIFTHSVVRENTSLLFGFNNKQKRALFRELIKTSSVGPKLALTILSRISTQQFANIVEIENYNELVKLPGIGKKTAKRLIMEMKDRFKAFRNNIYDLNDIDLIFSSLNVSLTDNAEQDAISTLIALGYKYKEANLMVSKIDIPNANSETLIREALRSAL